MQEAPTILVVAFAIAMALVEVYFFIRTKSSRSYQLVPHILKKRSQ